VRQLHILFLLRCNWKADLQISVDDTLLMTVLNSRQNLHMTHYDDLLWSTAYHHRSVLKMQTSSEQATERVSCHYRCGNSRNLEYTLHLKKGSSTLSIVASRRYIRILIIFGSNIQKWPSKMTFNFQPHLTSVVYYQGKTKDAKQYIFIQGSMITQLK